MIPTNVIVIDMKLVTLIKMSLVMLSSQIVRMRVAVKIIIKMSLVTKMKSTLNEIVINKMNIL